MSTYLSGEPDAGKPPVRFGGRGRGIPLLLPRLVDGGRANSVAPGRVLEEFSRCKRIPVALVQYRLA
jgi:hypothetical protein